MEIADRIKECKDDKELRKLTIQCLKEAKKISKRLNYRTDYIGYDLGVNPKLKFDESTKEFYCPCNLIDRWIGYIPKNIKYCYGYAVFKPRDAFNKDGEINALVNNDGWYYYLDDEKYIYEYFKYLKDHEVKDEFDLFMSIQDYIIDKFGENDYLTYDNMDINSRRDALQRLLMKENPIYSHAPIKEHSIKDFYGSNAGMCTEIGLLAQNILSTLGYIAIWVLDSDHVYNILIKENEDEDEQEEYYILDFSNGISCYDINYNLLEYQPYYRKIEDADPDYIKNFLDGKIKLEVPDYIKIKMVDYQHILPLNTTRIYGKKLFDFGDFVPNIEEGIVLTKTRREK